MSRIAHLSDLHIDGSPDRSGRFSRALRRAIDGECTHLVLTGDLTANGYDSEFEELSRLLQDCHSFGVTLAPGNHDLGDKDWRKVLATTSLERFAPTSMPGSATELGDTVVLALSTQYPGRSLLFRALGRVSPEQLDLLDTISSWTPVPVIAAMHHGPQLHPLQMFDGLVNRQAVVDLLERRQNVWVLCGHDHRVLDIGRVHAAPSVADHADPLRLYDVGLGGLTPVYQSRNVGNYLGVW